MSAPRFDPTLLYGRSDYGEIETRLRRLLTLEGLIPLDLGRELTPVMVVGDTVGVPGFSSRLRTFMSAGQAGGIGTGFWYKAEGADLIIDSIMLVVAVAGTFQCRYLGPSEADPVAFPNADSPMVDRAVSSGERSPLVRSAVVAGAGGVLLWNSVANLPVGYWQVNTRPFLLAAGAKIHVQGTQAHGQQLHGRLF